MPTWHTRKNKQLKQHMRPSCTAWQPSSKLGGEALWFGEDLGLTRRARGAKIKRERVKVAREDQRRRYSK